MLLKLKFRGMNVPQLAVGDGAMGFWTALEEVYLKTRHQRCWMHKTMNVLNCLPKSLQPKAKQALHEIWQANTRENAENAFDLFLATYEPKYLSLANSHFRPPPETEIAGDSVFPVVVTEISDISRFGICWRGAVPT